MGMAASQARLLSITARLSNNEHSAETVSYAKQRLADETQQITNEYNEALKATKLTVLTGFNGSVANYEDISYNLMTGLRMAENTRQYIVCDTKNRILVTEEIAEAFEYSRGDYNAFLAKLGYSQADISVQETDKILYDKDGNATTDKTKAVEQDNATKNVEKMIHQAWDKYFESVGINYGDIEHDGGYGWVETFISPENQTKAIGFGYASYTKGENTYPINYEGSTKESKDLFDYAMSITEAYYRTSKNNASVPFNMSDYKMANNTENTAALKYYRNIFDRIQMMGFVTYTDDANKANESDKKGVYIYSGSTVGTGKMAKNPLKDNVTFEAALRDGSLRLEYYSTTDRKFNSVTVSEDNCIQEVIDERAVARAESKFTQDMTRLEQQDKKFDMNLKRLDTEHNALQTEYDSMKTIIDKNIENSFKTFS